MKSSFDYEQFRINLQHLMDSRDFSNKGLADEIGITAPTLSRYLTGNRTPDLPYVVAISQFFNVSIDWLLGLNGDKFDIMPKELQEITSLYSVASPDDRNVVQAVLSKYRDKETK